MQIVQIIPAKPSDAGRLTEIAFAAKRHWGYPEQWIESWRNLLTITPEFIASRNTFFALAEGQIVGFGAVCQQRQMMELQHMWVLPVAMGRGIGRSLFRHAVERAKAVGCDVVEIESDPNAEGFYVRMGARRVGIRVGKVENQIRELPLLVYELRRTLAR